MLKLLERRRDSDLTPAAEKLLTEFTDRMDVLLQGRPVDLFAALTLTAHPEVREAVNHFEVDSMDDLHRRLRRLPSTETRIDFTMPHEGHAPSNDRLVCVFGDGRFSMAHQRNSGAMYEEGRVKPLFMELSKFEGVYTSEGFALATVKQLVHPYGEVSRAPASPEHVEYFRALREVAEARRTAPAAA